MTTQRDYALTNIVPGTIGPEHADRPSTATPGPSNSVAFFVPGRPAPQGSKSAKGRTRTGRVILVESSKSLKPWRETVRMHAIARHGVNPIDSGPVAMRIEFVMPRPQRTPKTITPPAVKRPDGDKLERAIFDALTGVMYRDDSQIVSCLWSKRIAEVDEQPGVAIRVDAL